MARWLESEDMVGEVLLPYRWAVVADDGREVCAATTRRMAREVARRHYGARVVRRGLEHRGRIEEPDWMYAPEAEQS